MENKKTTFKVHYVGASQHDGGGCVPQFTNITTMNGDTVEDTTILEAGFTAFEKMIKDCGEFVSTLVQIGEADYSTFQV